MKTFWTLTIGLKKAPTLRAVRYVLLLVKKCLFSNFQNEFSVTITSSNTLHISLSAWSR